MDTEFNEEQVHNNLDEQKEESAMNISSSNSSPQSSFEESDSENIEDENAKRIPELKQQIAANPKDENAYKQLIAIYNLLDNDTRTTSCNSFRGDGKTNKFYNM